MVFIFNRYNSNLLFSSGINQSRVAKICNKYDGKSFPIYAAISKGMASTHSADRAVDISLSFCHIMKLTSNLISRLNMETNVRR